MAGHKNWRTLLDKLSPEQRAEVDAQSREMMSDMVLAEIRKLAGLTQAQLAEALGVSQPMIARMERADTDDIQVSTLARIVKALGGELEITVKMPGAMPVRLTQFAA